MALNGLPVLGSLGTVRRSLCALSGVVEPAIPETGRPACGRDRRTFFSDSEGRLFSLYRFEP